MGCSRCPKGGPRHKILGTGGRARGPTYRDVGVSSSKLLRMRTAAPSTLGCSTGSRGRQRSARKVYSGAQASATPMEVSEEAERAPGTHRPAGKEPGGNGHQGHERGHPNLQARAGRERATAGHGKETRQLQDEEPGVTPGKQRATAVSRNSPTCTWERGWTGIRGR